MAHCSLEHSARAENTFYFLFIALTPLADGDRYQRAAPRLLYVSVSSLEHEHLWP